jgi:hypothetical protein
MFARAARADHRTQNAEDRTELEHETENGEAEA